MNNGNDLKIKLPVGYEKLEEYVKQTGKESMDIYKYAMFNCPELIADIDSLKDVLTKMSYNEQAVMVTRLLKVKAFIDSNRSHIKGKKLPPVNAFKNIFGEEIYKTVNDYLIKKGYEAVSSIKISNEKIYRFNKVSDNALNNLKKISDSDEFIYKTIYLLLSSLRRPVSVQEILEFLPQQREEEYKTTVDVLQNVIKSIHPNKDEVALIKDIFCANYFSVDKVCTGYYETLDVCDL